MERLVSIKSNKLYLPIKTGDNEEWLEIFCEGKKVFELAIPCEFCEDENHKNSYEYKAEKYENINVDKSCNGKYKYDYKAELIVEDYIGKYLLFKGKFPVSFFEAIDSENSIDEDADVLSNGNDDRPKLHFTANYGWINDPNGLIFDGEKYHIYFQYNPFNTKWANMSWGHASTKDFVHYEQHDDVMYPDERGMIFSGCGYILNDKMLFPYTIAGTSTPWSEGKPFYQGLAESNDGGFTLEKTKVSLGNPFLGITGKDSRDPKVFWHEPSKAYIMVLYLEKNDFGIFRSKDFYNWQQTCHMSIDKAWECPNLVEVKTDEGESAWVFYTADGFYYWGEFDGYEFKSDFEMHHAYINDVPYAAQTFFGTGSDVINLAWLRLGNNGNIYCGAMSTPRLFSAQKTKDGLRLVQSLLPQVKNRFAEVDTVPKDGAFMVRLEAEDKAAEALGEAVNRVTGETRRSCLTVNGTDIIIDFSKQLLAVDDEEYLIEVEFDFVEIIADYNILEISVGDFMIGAFNAKDNHNMLQSADIDKLKIYKLDEK